MNNQMQVFVMLTFMFSMLGVFAFVALWSAIGEWVVKRKVTPMAANITKHQKFDYWQTICPTCGLDIWGSDQFHTAQTYVKHWEYKHKLKAVK